MQILVNNINSLEKCMDCEKPFFMDIVRWNKYELDYDARGNIVKKTSYNADEEVEFITEHSYDRKGNELKFIMYNQDGSIGYWIEGEYDSHGNCLKSTYYNGNGTISYWEEREYVAIEPGE